MTATPLTRLLRGLPKSEVQLRIVEQSRAQLGLAEAAANTLAEIAKEADPILHEIQELEDGIALYSDIPQPQKQRQIAESLESKLQALKQQRKQMASAILRRIIPARFANRTRTAETSE